MMVWFIGFLLCGEILENVVHVPLPGNVIGMIMLFTALRFGWLKLDRVKGAAKFLLSHMMLFFAPIVVGTMVYANLLFKHPFASGSSIIVGTLLVLGSSGLTVSFMGNMTWWKKDVRGG